MWRERVGFHADTPEQAANLRARAQLMRQIAASVKESGRTQTEAAGQCGVTRRRMNDLLRGRASRFSIDALVNVVTAIGETVHFDLWTAGGYRLLGGTERGP
jgi:predicted XRE-type DNA-binding protein